jgi:hypothetical protein
LKINYLNIIMDNFYFSMNKICGEPLPTCLLEVGAGAREREAKIRAQKREEKKRWKKVKAGNRAFAFVRRVVGCVCEGSVCGGLVGGGECVCVMGVFVRGWGGGVGVF